MHQSVKLTADAIWLLQLVISSHVIHALGDPSQSPTRIWTRVPSLRDRRLTNWGISYPSPLNNLHLFSPNGIPHPPFVISEDLLFNRSACQTGHDPEVKTMCFPIIPPPILFTCNTILTLFGKVSSKNTICPHSNSFVQKSTPKPLNNFVNPICTKLWIFSRLVDAEYSFVIHSQISQKNDKNSSMTHKQVYIKVANVNTHILMIDFQAWHMLHWIIFSGLWVYCYFSFPHWSTTPLDEANVQVCQCEAREVCVVGGRQGHSDRVLTNHAGDSERGIFMAINYF